MKPIATYRVQPALPAGLERLLEIAYNLRWAWSHGTIELFRRVDPDVWETVGHNPVLFLGRVAQSRLEAVAADDAFVAHYQGICRSLDAYLSGEGTWFRRAHGERPGLAAYFSAEFGVTECLPIFAGGLGVLAGDHLKSASDLGVPLVGVGLIYQEGYFRQALNEAGWQVETYDEVDFHTLPLRRVRGADGNPLVIEVQTGGGPVQVQAWLAAVGRVPLYLLDTNVPSNSPAARDITDRLYGGEPELRIRQEIVLGIGGYRVLAALGLEPAVCHLNEGHAAFVGLERIRRLVEREGLSLEEARHAVAAGLLFTTHTPVEAGHDRFPAELVERELGDYARSSGLALEDLLALGRVHAGSPEEPFNLSVLALRLAGRSNAVSRVHGAVSRRMWQVLWPQVPEPEVPIDAITNGIHFASWISREMAQLYDRYLGPRWREEPASAEVWERSTQIPGEELWRTHELRRERLVAFVRRRARARLAARGGSHAELGAVDDLLNPDALTIGFARRFASYKRATLLLRDPERLARLLDDPDRPVQILYAGKAHPRDEPGKELIVQIVRLSRDPRFHRHLFFIEDYDLAAARYLVQGVDVWLNNPLPPLEASGTSGMKAAANGVLNLSTLDGWWVEAWEALQGRDPVGGWAIGSGEAYLDPAERDAAEAEALYAHLEQEVVPEFYERGPGGVPRRWIGRMKSSIAELCPRFNTHRMVREYTERLYLPRAERAAALVADGGAEARRLAGWHDRVRAAWPGVQVVAVDSPAAGDLEMGQRWTAAACIALGGLEPSEVRVELCYGRLDAGGEIIEPRRATMGAAHRREDGSWRYEAEEIASAESGLHGYTVRVLPSPPGPESPFVPGLITWAGPAAAEGSWRQD